MAEQTKLAWWYVIASIFFAILLFIGYDIIGDVSIYAIYRFGFLDFVVLGFAVYRIVRLLTQDKIFTFVREIFLDIDENGLRTRKPKPGLRRTCAELIECPWCTGLWAALVSVGLYLVSPFGRFVAIIFAIAGVGSLLGTMSNALFRVGEKR